MQLTIHDLLPEYFNKTRKESSEFWGKDFTIGAGENFKIVAPSGSGKTSLMHFLYGMRNEFSGNIEYDGHPIKDMNPEKKADLRSNKLSIVFQDLRLFASQTVAVNLEIKRQLNPYHPKEKIGEMARRLGIGDKLASQCSTCSYGEQQRIAIIRSLLQPFDLLLLDEPFSHLDTANSQRAMELILEEAALRDAAIIFADLERIDYFPFTRLYHL